MKWSMAESQCSQTIKSLLRCGQVVKQQNDRLAGDTPIDAVIVTAVTGVKTS